jgi:uncharacterized protein YxjI
MIFKDFFNLYPEVFIKQSKEWTEIFTGIETRNKYLVQDRNKNKIGWVVETGAGFIYHFKKFLLRSHRPLKVDFLDNEGKKLLHFHRDFYWFWSDLYVTDHEGHKLGSIHRRFAWFYKKYDIMNSNHSLIGKIESGFWKLWKFEVSDHREQIIGEINKKWGGMLKEIFTDTDSFLVQFKNSTITPEIKALIFATAISIDMDYFDNNSNSVLNIISD